MWDTGRVASIEPGLSVALLRPLAEILGRLDVDARAFLDALDIDDAAAPDTYVSAARVDQLLAEIARRRGDPTFSLTLARAAVVRNLGLFGHMVWMSGTVRDALARAVKFFSVVTRRTTLSFEEAGGLGILRQHPVPGQPRGAILTEFPFVSLALRARHATDGRFALRAVRFAHRSDHAAAYREAFGCDVTFRAARDELEIESAMLDLSLASADPITAAALEARVAELTRGSVRSPLVERVRRAALATLAHGPSLDSLARQLAVSARTLRRQLAQEHTTVRAIVDEVRRERADHLLAQGEAVKAVASALGFSEASAFSRAYKRWTGRPPG